MAPLIMRTTRTTRARTRERIRLAPRPQFAPTVRSARRATTVPSNATIPRASSAHETSTSTSWPSEAAARTAFGTAATELADAVARIENGALPAWLNGRFYRNGPGTYENGTEEGMLHLFDGYGMLVKVGLDGGSNAAVVTNAFVRSSAYTVYSRTGKMGWREFGTARPLDTAVERMGEVLGTIGGAMGLGETKGVTDNAAVHVIERIVVGGKEKGKGKGKGKELWAMTETVRCMRLWSHARWRGATHSLDCIHTRRFPGRLAWTR